MVKKSLPLKNACPCFQMEFSHSITSQSLRDTGIQLVQVFQLKHQTSAEGGKPNTVHLYFHVRSDMASISKHNMILMSKYKGQHGGKKGKQIRARPSPPPFSGNARKKSIFLMGGVPLLWYINLGI